MPHRPVRKVRVGFEPLRSPVCPVGLIERLTTHRDQVGIAGPQDLLGLDTVKIMPTACVRSPVSSRMRRANGTWKPRPRGTLICRVSSVRPPDERR